MRTITLSALVVGGVIVVRLSVPTDNSAWSDGRSSVVLPLGTPAVERAPQASVPDLSHFLALCRSDRSVGIALGDVNGDGRLDMAFANGRHEPQPNLLYVSSRGRDRFYAPRQVGNAASYSVVFADIDRDQDLDLVEGNDFGFWNIVWLNDGHGNFSPDAFFGAADRTREVAVGDLTGDGYPDIVTSNFVVERDDSSKVYVNNGKGRFEESHALPVGDADAAAVALGDFNRDGRLDIVLGTLSRHPNYLLLNDGTGHFRQATPFGDAESDGEGLAVGDLDGDGNLDVVVGNTGQQDKVFFGDGKGVFPRFLTFGSGADRTRAVALGDMDGDGDLDVVAGYEAVDYVQSEPNVGLFRIRDESARIFFNDGRGNLSAGSTFGPTGSPIRGIALGDIDGDGRLDVVVSNDCTRNHVHFNRPSVARR